MPRDPNRHTRSRPVGRLYKASDLPNVRQRRFRRRLNLAQWVAGPNTTPPHVSIIFGNHFYGITNSFISNFRRDEYPYLRHLWNYVMLATPRLPRWDHLSNHVPRSLPFDYRYLQVHCMNTPAPFSTFQPNGPVTGPADAERMDGVWIRTMLPRNQ